MCGPAPRSVRMPQRHRRCHGRSGSLVRWLPSGRGSKEERRRRVETLVAGAGSAREVPQQLPLRIHWVMGTSRRRVPHSEADLRSVRRQKGLAPPPQLPRRRPCPLLQLLPRGVRYPRFPLAAWRSKGLVLSRAQSPRRLRWFRSRRQDENRGPPLRRRRQRRQRHQQQEEQQHQW